MTSLPDFEDDLREAILDEAEAEIEDARDRLVADTEAGFRSYASRNGYDIDHIWRDVTTGTVDRRQNAVSTRVEWPALTALFEYGVDPHTITGNPTLAFNWPSPPQGTRPPGAPSYVVAESVNWGSVTGGIDAARAIRTAHDALRADLRGGV
jgi:hypothetical protein